MVQTDELVALVTGANKGIGFATARQLAERGVFVFLGSRDEGRGREAAGSLGAEGLRVEALPLDVTDEASVAAAARTIRAQRGRLDILVNNAGVPGAMADPPSEVTVAMMRHVYDTNVFGVVAVTNAMLPLLRESPAARIVNVSSGLGSLERSADAASEFGQLNVMGYQSSKTALNAVTVAYAKELASAGIKVNAGAPGLTATDMNGGHGDRKPAQAAGILVHLALLGPGGPTGSYVEEQGPVPW